MHNKTLSNEQQSQEDIYTFPYHYLPHIKNGSFKQSRTLEWGYEYQSYIEFVLLLLSKIEFESLLDIGCGDGRFTYEIGQRHLGKRLIGTDYSERALSFARAFHPNGHYVVGDIIDSTLFNEQFDVATLIETLEHIEIKKVNAFVLGIARYVKPGGIFIVTVPSTTRPVNPKHYQHFTLDSLTKALNPYFTIEEHYFLNKVGKLDYLINRLFTNRFFILNEMHLTSFLYKFYKKYLMTGSPSETQRICVIARKK